MTCQFFNFPLPHSEIHDTLFVIANEVKQSSKTKMHFFNHLDCRADCASAALRSQLRPCCNDEAFRIPRIRGNDVPVF